MYNPYEGVWNGNSYDRQVQSLPSFPIPQVGGFPSLPIGGGGTGPGQGSGGQSIPPAPPQHIISQYQQAVSQPQSMQPLIAGQSVGGGPQTVQFAAGCNRRWTIVFLRNGQVFLMYVISSQPFGRTTGFIWPNFTFGSFPSSSILAYSCS
ncbi:hypothetical protein GPA07_10845 [Bacillus sp. ms-22]|uniref:hypothetical protein n=1 Tax=Bacillus sp. ms-22 TaxID=2683680 RepID=UPI0012FCDA26|nr:hypothetical protein [Bacillus sp. ms-22]QGX65914.1 hypothetical protein GPA07_10845 [Bacillus sp. ms-22]